VVCNEGERARQALIALRAVADKLTIIQDGQVDETTDQLSREYASDVVVYPKKGCKEPHLALFFAQFRNESRWFLHVDSDEILSDELKAEIATLDLSEPDVYSVELAHTLKDGTSLKYKKGSGRVVKPILFHNEKLRSVIGLPHGALKLDLPWRKLDAQVIHRAGHLNFSFRQLFEKEKRFARTDARLRSLPVKVLGADGLLEIESTSNSFGFTNWLRNSHPLLALPLSATYQFAQSLWWLADVRSMKTLVSELQMLPIRPFYQAYLCYLIWQMRNIQTNGAAESG